MNGFRIFTEGVADIKFLTDYISEIFGKFIPRENFDTLGSWSGYKTKGRPTAAIRQNFDTKRQTIIIIDADSNFEQRKGEVTADFKSFQIPLSLYLFPNNLKHGNLESILAEIATQREIMDCFLAYENCVNGHPKPLNHARIYSYLDLLLHPNPFDTEKRDLRQDEFRDFKNQKHWNLKHDCLTPLKDFLNPLFN